MSKNRCIKVFAWLLSVIMIFSMMPVAVLAEEPVKDVNTSAPKTEDTIGGSVTLPFVLEEPGASSDETLNGASGGSSGEMKFKASLEYIRTENGQEETVSMAEGDPDPNKDYVIRIKFDPNGAAFKEIHDFGFRLDYVKVTGTPDPNGPYKYEVDEVNKTIAFHWQNTTGERPSFTLDIPCKPAFPEPEGWNFKGNEYAIVANVSNAMMIPSQKVLSDRRQVIDSASCSIVKEKLRNNELNDNTSYWTITHVSGSWYSISYGEQYVSIEKANKKDTGAILTQSSVALKVENDNANNRQIYISDGEGRYLTNAGSNPATGFGAWKDGNGRKGQEMNLYTADQMTHDPTKDIPNGRAIVNDSVGTLLTVESASNNKLKTEAFKMVADGKAMVIREGAEATLWDFVKITGDWYNIKSGDNKYINLANGKLSVSSTAQPIFVRHFEKSDLFALSDTPYSSIGKANYRSKSNLAFYQDDTASVKCPESTTFNNDNKGIFHIYDPSKYEKGYQLRLREPAGEDDNYLLLTLDYNGGTVTGKAPVKTKNPEEARDAEYTATQIRVKTQENDEIVLPELEGAKDGAKFIGWATVSDFYKLENGSTYHSGLLLPGDTYTMENDSTTLYAVWDVSKGKLLFSMKLDGIIPIEPYTGNISDYHHITKNNELIDRNNIKTPKWIIDPDGTEEISATTGGYVKNDVVANLEPEIIPNDNVIKARMAEKNITYNPETQYVHWYVLKYTGSEWHVDGVICNRKEATVHITGKDGEKVYNGQDRSYLEYDISIESDGDGLTENDITIATGTTGAVGKNVDGGTNEDKTYPMGLTEDLFINHNPAYHVTFDIVKDGSLKITPRPITLQANDATSEYTGSTITYATAAKPGASYYTITNKADDDIEDGLAAGHTIADIALTGEGTKVSEKEEDYPIKITEDSVIINDENGGEVTSNYAITLKDGLLKITPNTTLITVTPGSGSKVYDGTALKKTEHDDFKVTGVLPDGFTWTAQADGAVTNVTPGEGEKAENAVTEFKIFNTAREDVTDQFSNIDKSAKGTLSITPRKIWLIPNDAKSEYTGDEITYLVQGEQNYPYYTIGTIAGIKEEDQGLAKDQSITAIELNGKGTKVKADGYPITITEGTVKISDANQKEVTANYEFVLDKGTLTITQNTAAITVVPGSGSKTYDGTPLTLTADVKGVPKGFTWSVETDGTVTNVNPGTGEKTENAVTEFKIFNAAGENVTDQFSNIDKSAKGTLSITARPIKLIANSASNEYTGGEITYATAQDAKSPYYGIGKIENIDEKDQGLAKDQSITAITLTGAGTLANTYPITIDANSVKIGDGQDKDFTANYTITVEPGQLVIDQNTAAITVVPGSGSKIYDGTPLTMTEPGDFTVTGVPEGFTWTAQADGAVTNVTPGEGEKAVNAVTEFKIFNAAGEDVTGQFSKIDTTATGKLTINARPIKLTANNASNEYTGNEITYATAQDAAAPYYTIEDKQDEIDGLAPNQSITAVTLTGAGTMVRNGGYPIEIDAKSIKIGDSNNSDVTANYTITVAGGTLTINQNSSEITVVPATAEKIYDGTALTKTEHDDFSVTGVPEGFTWTAKANGTVTNVTPGEGEKAANAVTDFRIFNAAGEEVTSQFSKIDTTAVGTLTINPRPIHLIANDVNNVYNGSEITYATAGDAAQPYYTIEDKEDVEDGLVPKQEITKIELTGAGTTVGAYPTAITEGSVAIGRFTDNYAISLTPGTLTISQVPEVTVTITEHGGELTYDAAAHTVSGYDVASSDPLYTTADFTFSGTASVTGTNAGTYAMNLKPEDFANTNENFANVNFVIVDDQLKINQRAVTIQAEDKTKTYGSADPTLTSTTKGLAGTDYIVTSLTRAEGNSVGTYSIEVAYEANPNYVITPVNGVLTISPKTVTVTAKDEAKIYGEADPELTAKVEGLAYEDGADLISYTVERATGEDAGEYTITPAGDAEQGNYTVKYETGTMTIYPLDTVVVRITANNGIYEYDGQEKDLSGYSVQISDPQYTENDFTFSGSSELKATNAGTYSTKMTAADFANTNDNFTNVAFIVENGELEIQKRKISITSADAEKAYDGTALRAEEATYEGSFAEGEGAVLTYTGRITQEGSVPNSFSYTLTEGTNADNYDITTIFGTLTVTRNAAARTQRLTITYVNEDGETLKTFARDYQVGTNYSVATEKISGYTADIEKVTGTMGEEDVNVTVTYSKVTYNLTVQFVDVNNGREVAQAVTLSMKEGDSYAIFVPRVEGYVSKISEVTGAMPGSNRTITVFMIPEGDADSGRYHAAIDIDDYGTPLGVENSILGGGEIIE